MCRVNPPWPVEGACEFARMHVEEGPFNGLFLVGGPEVTGVVPCIESPLDTAGMIGLQILAGKLASPEWLIFIADTYHFEGDGPEPPAGSLGDAFLAGDPRVKEATVVLCICPDGPSYHATQTYVRDGEEIEWDEIDVSTDVAGLGGVMRGVMVNILATPYGVAPEAANFVEQLRVEL